MTHTHTSGCFGVARIILSSTELPELRARNQKRMNRPCFTVCPHLRLRTLPLEDRQIRRLLHDLTIGRSQLRYLPSKSQVLVVILCHRCFLGSATNDLENASCRRRAREASCLQVQTCIEEEAERQAIEASLGASKRRSGHHQGLHRCSARILLFFAGEGGFSLQTHAELPFLTVGSFRTSRH